MKSKIFFMTIAMMFLAIPMFAQGGTTTGTTDWRPVTAGLAMAIASGLCALGQGKAVSGASEAMARNPGATAAIRFGLLLGLVLIESLALYTFAIVFMKVG